jgi:translation initiation factor 5A
LINKFFNKLAPFFLYIVILVLYNELYKETSRPIKDDEPCMVIESDHHKSGKHGAAKNRISCVGLFDKKKRSVVYPSDKSMDVPEIEKHAGQATDISEDAIFLMNAETYEMIEIPKPADDDEQILKDNFARLLENRKLLETTQIEYWRVVERNQLKRIIIN